MLLGGVLGGLLDLGRRFLRLLCHDLPGVLRDLLAVLDSLLAGLPGLVFDLISDRSQTLVLDLGRREQQPRDEPDRRSSDRLIAVVFR